MFTPICSVYSNLLQFTPVDTYSINPLSPVYSHWLNLLQFTPITPIGSFYSNLLLFTPFYSHLFPLFQFTPFTPVHSYYCQSPVYSHLLPLLKITPVYFHLLPLLMFITPIYSCLLQFTPFTLLPFTLLDSLDSNLLLFIPFYSYSITYIYPPWQTKGPATVWWNISLQILPFSNPIIECVEIPHWNRRKYIFTFIFLFK